MAKVSGCDDITAHLHLGQRPLVPACINATLIDYSGNLVGLHTVTGAGDDVEYGLSEFHQTLIIDSQYLIDCHSGTVAVWCVVQIRINGTARLKTMDVNNRVPKAYL